MEDLKVEIRSVALRNIPSTGTFKFRADDNADYTTDENITGSTSNPEQNLIPLENWTINAPNPAGSLTYGDGAAHNVNLQRYDYTLGEMVELDGTTAEAKDLLEGDQWLLIPQDFVKNNYYYENVNYVWPETTSTQGAYLVEMRVLRKKLNADNEFEGWTQIFPEPGATRKDNSTVTDGDFGWGAIGLLLQRRLETRHPLYLHAPFHG